MKYNAKVKKLERRRAAYDKSSRAGDPGYRRPGSMK